MTDQEQGSNQGRDQKQKQGTQTPDKDWNNRNRTDAESTSGAQRSGSTDAETCIFSLISDSCVHRNRPAVFMETGQPFS